MATASSDSPPSGEYRIYNYFRPSDPPKTFQDIDSWKTEIKELTRGKMMTNKNVYTSPLKTIEEYFGKWPSEFARIWLSGMGDARSRGFAPSLWGVQKNIPSFVKSIDFRHVILGQK